MIKKILLALLVVIAGFVILVLTRPSEFTVTRSATLAAPQSIVFEQVNDLQKWQSWSPWAKLDPNAKNTFSGPTAGVGAAFAWSGNSEVGEGTMTITESKPTDLVRFKLEFKKPFEATSATEFTFKPEGEKTRVTWTMSGQNGFIGKAISLFMNCDKMVGGQFEQGFENLRGMIEKKAPQ